MDFVINLSKYCKPYGCTDMKDYLLSKNYMKVQLKELQNLELWNYRTII